MTEFLKFKHRFFGGGGNFINYLCLVIRLMITRPLAKFVILRVSYQPNPQSFPQTTWFSSVIETLKSVIYDAKLKKYLCQNLSSDCFMSILV